MEKISYETKDGVKIVGNYWPASAEASAGKAIVLLHMMPTTKESWDKFAALLNQNGWNVLAIDLRGHGESGGGDYKNFTDEQHQKSINDVEGARQWLVEKAIAAENIYIGGASIGANLAIRYLAAHQEAPAAIVLSPGLDYRGVKTDGPMLKISDSQKIYLAAAEDDKYSADSVRELEKLGGARKTTKIFPSGGHGTNLFNSQPELMEELVNWLSG